MPKGYSMTQIRLHWIVVLLILFQFVFSDAIGAALRQAMRGEVPAFDAMVMAHVVVGFAIGALVLWRILLRATRGVPSAPAEEHALLRMAAHWTHLVLYGLMLLLPISGALAWFGMVEAAAEAHEVMKALLMVLTGLHVVAALWHQFWLKDGLLLRMKQPLD